MAFQTYPGDLGKRIFENVSKQAWQSWLAHQTMLINENRLSPMEPAHRKFLEDEMEKYFFGGGSELELIDSGFGPFALEHLCQTSGGRFLALRPGRDNSSLASSAAWPSGAAYNFAPQAMRRYAPEYVSHARYRQLLEENVARQALYQCFGG